MEYASLALSCISVLISIWAIRYVHLHNHQQKQIDLVIELLDNIHERNVWATYITNQNGSHTMLSLFSGNLLDIALTKQSLEELNDVEVVFSEESCKRLNINRFSKKTILPSKIKESLELAFPKEATFSRRSDGNRKLVYITESRTLDAKEIDDGLNLEREKYFCHHHVNLGTFLVGVNNLKSEIKNWLKNKNVRDVRI